MEINQYTEVFLDESREHLQAVNDNLLKLEKQPNDLSIVDEIFRSAHTLKGMSATMGYESIASLTHQMENVLDKIRNDELKVSTEVIDVTFLAIESLEDMVEEISAGNDGFRDVSDLITRLKQIETGEINETTTNSNEKKDLGEVDIDEYQMTVISQAKEQGHDAYYVCVKLTKDCVLKAVRAYMVVEVLEKNGEIIQTIPTVEDLEEGNFDQSFILIFLSKKSSLEIETMIHKISEINSVEVKDLSNVMEQMTENRKSKTKSLSKRNNEDQPSKGKGAPSKTIRVNLERIDNLMNLFEEVVIDRSRLENLLEDTGNQDVRETVEHMSWITKEMQNLILALRMVPVEQVFNRFPRMIRGLARDLNKKINVDVIGSETEIDRTVIDEIGDPLVHLIRNSIDHGIELPEKRKKNGKPAEGNLTLRAFHSGNHVFIEIEDDGAGIDREKVAAKALENGIITLEESKSLPDEDIFQLILSSGFSTAETVSDVSGRGVGLDVVTNTIESLGGQINIESWKGKGSKFSIQLPLTLSILSTLLVSVQEEIYAIPLSSIIETMTLDRKEIMSAHGNRVIDFRGNVIPLVSIKEIFNVPTNWELEEISYSIVIVKKGEKLTGLIVDSFIGQEEIVLKSLGNYLKDIYAISGATILGDGQVALIIDPNVLIR